MEEEKKGFVKKIATDLAENTRTQHEISKLLNEIVRMGSKELHRQAKSPVKSYKENQQKVLDAMYTVREYVSARIENGQEGIN